ncbi:MAG: hemolysin family protein [Erysipelotrichaceae bacterium]|jgi:CBS domain containing-hemolysin-like protein|nr:hemolysin family protein [Erysipelotrichaceae bacterium]
MEADGWVLWLFIAALLLASGYFASAETAFASVSAIRIRTQAENGDHRAKNALYILEHFEKALSTLLVGNNIAHIATASLVTLLVSRTWGDGYLTLATLATTLVVFLFAEMIPKSLATDKPERIALLYAGSLRFFMVVLSPLALIFGAISTFISKVSHTESPPTVTEDELYDIIESIGESSDSEIKKDQSELIQSALEFDDTTAAEILTPRVNLVAVDIEAKPREILDLIRKNHFSRLPVYKESLDQIVGFFPIRKYLQEYQKHKKVSLKSLLLAPYFVPSKKRIDELFADMSKNKQHMAVVVDDRGGTMGIITMEDILEELVGEIWDEDDLVREDFKEIGGNRYEINGDMDLDDALEQLGQKPLDLGITIGAWVQKQAPGIIKRGSTLHLGELRIKVTGMDKHRHITKLQVRKQAEDSHE